MFDPDVAALLGEGGALIVGTVGLDGAPTATRGWGIRWLADEPTRVRLVLDAHEGGALTDLATCGAIAVTAADVATLRSVQIKGRVTAIEAATDDDRKLVQRHVDAFFGAIVRADGARRAVLDRWIPLDHVSCTLEVTDVFDQTPGPAAGAVLSGPGAPGARRSPVAAGGPDGAAPVGGAHPGADSAPTLRDLTLSFEGAVPAVIATAAADGAPNVTYLSRVRRVDDERVALSNQFLSKTARNLAENPRASLLVLDPTNYDQHRLSLVYERTDRRGPVFDRLRKDVDAMASLHGMEQVFRLRAADIFRVVDIRHVPAAIHLTGGDGAGSADRRSDGELRPPPDVTALAALTGRLARSADLDTVVGATVDGLADLLGYRHAQLCLVDETTGRLVTIASCGYGDEGVGAEVRLGDGAIGVAALRCAPVRIGNLRQMGKYARSVRRSYEDHGGIGPGRAVPLPGLPDAESQLAVPALALGQLVAVLAVESDDPVAFDDLDEAVLQTVAAVLAGAIEAARADERAEGQLDRPDGPGISSASGWVAGHGDGRATGRPAAAPVAPPPVAAADAGAAAAATVRFFEADGSVFVDAEYLIKGVAGRILWSLLQHHRADGRVDFTNKELRCNPALDLPEYRDNLESRLILLKRRLDERSAPVRIEKTGRGRFRLVMHAPVTLVAGATA